MKRTFLITNFNLQKKYKETIMELNLDIVKNTVSDLMFINNVISIYKTVDPDDAPIYTAVTGGASIVYADYDPKKVLEFLKEKTAYLNKDERKVAQTNINTDIDNN